MDDGWIVLSSVIGVAILWWVLLIGRAMGAGLRGLRQGATTNAAQPAIAAHGGVTSSSYVTEGPSSPDFHIDAAAVRYIAENGRRVYIRSQAVGSDFGTIKTSLDDPQLEGSTFFRYCTEGLEVFVDATIPPGADWRLSYHRFPRRHIRADWNVAHISVRGA